MHECDCISIWKKRENEGNKGPSPFEIDMVWWFIHDPTCFQPLFAQTKLKWEKWVKRAQKQQTNAMRCYIICFTANDASLKIDYYYAVIKKCMRSSCFIFRLFSFFCFSSDSLVFVSCSWRRLQFDRVPKKWNEFREKLWWRNFITGNW